MSEPEPYSIDDDRRIYLKINEAAELATRITGVQISPVRVRQWAHEGVPSTTQVGTRITLPVRRINRADVVRRSDLLAFLDDDALDIAAQSSR